jgi:hypothetical protein
MAKSTTLWVLVSFLGVGCGVSGQQGSEGQSGSAQEGAGGSLAGSVKAYVFGSETLKCPQSDAYKAMRGRVSVETSFQIANLVCPKTADGGTLKVPGGVAFVLKTEDGDSISLRDDREFECTQQNTGALVRARPTAAIDDSRGVTWDHTQIIIPIADAYVEQGDSVDPQFSPRPVAELGCEYLEPNRTSTVRSGDEGTWPLQTPYFTGESDLDCTVAELSAEGSTLEVIEYANVHFEAKPGSGDIPVTVELTDEDGSTSHYDDVVSILQPLWPRNSQGTIRTWTIRPRLETWNPWDRDRIVDDFKAMTASAERPQCVYSKSPGSTISVE